MLLFCPNLLVVHPLTLYSKTQKSYSCTQGIITSLTSSLFSLAYSMAILVSLPCQIHSQVPSYPRVLALDFPQIGNPQISAWLTLSPFSRLLQSCCFKVKAFFSCSQMTMLFKTTTFLPLPIYSLYSFISLFSVALTTVFYIIFLLVCLPL